MIAVLLVILLHGHHYGWQQPPVGLAPVAGPVSGHLLPLPCGHRHVRAPFGPCQFPPHPGILNTGIPQPRILTPPTRSVPIPVPPVGV